SSTKCAQHLALLGSCHRRDAVSYPAHPDGSRHGILCGKRTVSADGRVHQVSPDSAAVASFERQGRAIPTNRVGGILVATFAKRGSSPTAHRRVATHLQLQTFARWAGW